jgi:hypothetical protein
MGQKADAGVPKNPHAGHVNDPKVGDRCAVNMYTKL